MHPDSHYHVTDVDRSPMSHRRRAASEPYAQFVGEALGFPAPLSEGVGLGPLDLPRSLPEARANALRDMFPLSASWRATPAQRHRMLEAVQFVSRASSLADLNARVRRVARVFSMLR